jgi:hypothetical protein
MASAWETAFEAVIVLKSICNVHNFYETQFGGCSWQLVSPVCHINAEQTGSRNP